MAPTNCPLFPFALGSAQYAHATRGHIVIVVPTSRSHAHNIPHHLQRQLLPTERLLLVSALLDHHKRPCPRHSSVGEPPVGCRERARFKLALEFFKQTQRLLHESSARVVVEVYGAVHLVTAQRKLLGCRDVAD